MMKITIESTTQICELNGSVRARVWEGTTESGIPVICLVTLIAVHQDHDTSQFDRELTEQKAPSLEAIRVFPLRLII